MLPPDVLYFTNPGTFARYVTYFLNDLLEQQYIIHSTCILEVQITQRKHNITSDRLGDILRAGCHTMDITKMQGR